MIMRTPLMQNAVENGSEKKINEIRNGAEWIMLFQIFGGWVSKIAIFTREAVHSMLS